MLASCGAEIRGFQRVSIDSREVVENSLFVAFAGNRSDGHDFISEALSRGCGGGPQ